MIAPSTGDKMIPVVNDQHRYLFLYAAKSGCTSIRRIYLELHKHEMSNEELSSLNKYHNLNEVFPYDHTKDYSQYTSFMLSRNPYGRIVSAFLDQYVFSRNASVKSMLSKYSTGQEPSNFLEFLELLKNIPNEERDGHFRTQSYFPYMSQVVTQRNFKYKWFNKKPIDAFGLRYSEDVSKLNYLLRKVYKRIFRNNKAMLSKALEIIEQTRKRNSLSYSDRDFDNAALLNTSELDEMVFPPKPQDFFTNSRVIELVQEIYQQDFELFGYHFDDIPHKHISKNSELLPKDFDWKIYLDLNPDLSPNRFYNERSAVRHYLEFGQFELHLRAYKITTPDGFNWRNYVSLHPDLVRAGIDTKEEALKHYLRYGLREKRAF